MTEQERSKKYNCDGKCYGTNMCPMVDTCPETRMGEFLATIGAAIILVFIPIITFVSIILMIMRYFYG